jgi:hypothetical protein
VDYLDVSTIVSGVALHESGAGQGNELRETSFSGGLQLLLTNLRKASTIREGDVILRSDRVVLPLKGMIKEQYFSPKLTRRVIGGE